MVPNDGSAIAMQYHQVGLIGDSTACHNTRLGDHHHHWWAPAAAASVVVGTRLRVEAKDVHIVVLIHYLVS